MAAITEAAPYSGSRLLALPAELRLKIYDHTLLALEAVTQHLLPLSQLKFRVKGVSKLLHICRQIRYEIKALCCTHLAYIPNTCQRELVEVLRRDEELVARRRELEEDSNDVHAAYVEQQQIAFALRKDTLQHFVVSRERFMLYLA
jgi:hypothetical protein